MYPIRTSAKRSRRSLFLSWKKPGSSPSISGNRTPRTRYPCRSALSTVTPRGHSWPKKWIGRSYRFLFNSNGPLGPSSGKEAKLTTELERIKILEGKISQVIEYVNKLTAENDKLKQQVKEFKAGVRDYEEQSRRTVKFEKDLKRSEGETEAIKAKIEAIIGQIDKLGL